MIKFIKLYTDNGLCPINDQIYIINKHLLYNSILCIIEFLYVHV